MGVAAVFEEEDQIIKQEQEEEEYVNRQLPLYHVRQSRKRGRQQIRTAAWLQDDALRGFEEKKENLLET